MQHELCEHTDLHMYLTHNKQYIGCLNAQDEHNLENGKYGDLLQ